MITKRVGLMMAVVLGLNVGMMAVASQGPEAPAKQDTVQGSTSGGWSKLKTVLRYGAYVGLGVGALACLYTAAGLYGLYAMDSNFGAEFAEQYHRTRGERAVRNKLAYCKGLISGVLKSNDYNYYRYY